MCGRFVLDKRATDLTTLFDVDVLGEGLPQPSWNIAPTQRIAVVIDSLPKGTTAGGSPDNAGVDNAGADNAGADNADTDWPEPIRRLESARWGLVPGFATDPKAGPPLFNARSEEVGEKASFSAALAKRRAVIPATGYYEWRVADGVKTPQFVSLPGDELLLFAGLYEWWRNPAVAADSPDRWLLSATVLTRSSTAELATIHDRMPVFLDSDLVEGWLDPVEEGTQELVDEVAAAAAEVAGRAQFWQVGGDVGNVNNNGSALIAPQSV